VAADGIAGAADIGLLAVAAAQADLLLGDGPGALLEADLSAAVAAAPSAAVPLVVAGVNLAAVAGAVSAAVVSVAAAVEAAASADDGRMEQKPYAGWRMASFVGGS